MIFNMEDDIFCTSFFIMFLSYFPFHTKHIHHKKTWNNKMLGIVNVCALCWAFHPSSIIGLLRWRNPIWHFWNLFRHVTETKIILPCIAGASLTIDPAIWYPLILIYRTEKTVNRNLEIYRYKGSNRNKNF